MTGDFDGEFMLTIPHAPTVSGNIGSEIRTLLCVIRNEVKFAIDNVIAAVA